MKRWKFKIVALALCVMMAFSLTACGKKSMGLSKEDTIVIAIKSVTKSDIKIKHIDFKNKTVTLEIEYPEMGEILNNQPFGYWDKDKIIKDMSKPEYRNTRQMDIKAN